MNSIENKEKESILICERILAFMHQIASESRQFLCSEEFLNGSWNDDLSGELWLLSEVNKNKIYEDLVFHKFNPLIEVFLAEVDEFSISKNHLKRDNYCSFLLNRLREAIGCANFHRDLRNFQKKSEKCYVGLAREITEIGQNNSKILSIQISLSYKIVLDGSTFKYPSIYAAKKHLTDFLKYLRKSAPFRLLGYCWSMKWMPSTGAIFHIWVLIDGSHHQNFLAFGNMLGAHWVNVITDSQGQAYIYASTEESDRKFPVGLLEGSKLNELEFYGVLAYLTKFREAIYYSPDQNVRTYGRSVYNGGKKKITKRRLLGAINRK